MKQEFHLSPDHTSRSALHGGIWCFLFLLLALLPQSLRADVMDDCSDVRRAWDVVFLDLYGGRIEQVQWSDARTKTLAFEKNFQSAETHALWKASLPETLPQPALAARIAGEWQARIQHALALEMLAAYRAQDTELAREWRALIQMPKYADAVQGALALQNNSATQREAAAQLLAREYLVWQTTLVREKSDYLKRMIHQDRVTPELFAARAAEIDGLASFPSALVQIVVKDAPAHHSNLDTLLAAGPNGEAFAHWQTELQNSLPSLITPEEAARRERLLIKLLKLVPKEYQSGVRDGEITVPLEYREAQQFTIQARQTMDELRTPWQRGEKAKAYQENGLALFGAVESLEEAIAKKAPLSEIEKHADDATGLLESKFGISLRRSGKASEVVAETLIDIRSLLASSLVAARQGDWKQAEALRMEAYTNFDLEIEIRALPRDPTLAMKAERAFLDGAHNQPGIKAVLDARERSEALSAAYQTAIDLTNQCGALLQMAVSPATAIYNTISVVMREGLEAVVILAALLAGLRGVENRRIRVHIGLGAGAALIASALTFVLSRWIIGSFTSYGERLEAVVSVLAVIVLLIVTNWVFHKMYWVDWNTKLRHLTRAVASDTRTKSTSFAMIGVGFLTIYREGFETVLFLQSLILEAGVRSVLTGLLIGGAAVCACGGAVFVVGMKLPYRKMLVFTGILVITVLVTFLGSTTRLFQTSGWLSVHPIAWLDFPQWMGTWLGLYPSWEGVLIPPLGFVYVGGAWLYMKWKSARNAANGSVKSAYTPMPKPQQESAEYACERAH